MESKIGPFMKSKTKTSRMMIDLFIALIPIILFSFYKNGIVPYSQQTISLLEMFYPLIFIIVGSLSSMLFETVYICLFKRNRKSLIKELKGSYCIFPGLFLSLILPINTPLTILFVGTLFAVVIGKMIYGGFGNNIFNPALIGCLFVVACYGTVISSNGGYMNAYELDTISKATPLTNVGLIDGIGTYKELVQPYGSLLNFFIGTIPGAIGETSALLCIVAYIYLTLTKVIKWRIPIIYIGTVFVMTSIIGLLNGTGMWYPLFQILSGGLFFGAVFMATDPVTSPVTKNGQIIYGICLGILTVVFRYLTSYPEGVLTSILTMNMFVFILDKFGVRSRFKSSMFYIVLVIAIVSSIGVGFGISTTYSKVVSETDSNFKVVSKKMEDKKITYVVTQKGFGGNIKGQIIISDDKITSIEILDSNESVDRFKLITDAKYIDRLIKEQDTIEDVDAVSSATVSSIALKKMVINTLKDSNSKSEEVVPEEPPKLLTIIDKEVSGNATNYRISFQSFGGPLTMDVVVTDGIIKNIRLISFSDSCVDKNQSNPYYKCPCYLNDEYINNLIKNQANLSGIDTVSGATISSKSIKNALVELLQEDVKNEE